MGQAEEPRRMRRDQRRSQLSRDQIAGSDFGANAVRPQGRQQDFAGQPPKADVAPATKQIDRSLPQAPGLVGTTQPI